MADVEEEILLQANLFFFKSTDFEFLLAHLAPIQMVAFSIASDNDLNLTFASAADKLNFSTIFSHQLAFLFLSLKSLQC